MKLREFVQDFWPTVEPKIPLIGGWVLDSVCDHLQAVSEGKIKNLIVNVPPGFGMSTLAGVLWPAWEWGELDRRKSRWMFGSYSSVLAHRDAGRCHDLLSSAAYRSRYSDALNAESSRANFYETNRGGWRLSFGVGAAIAGHRADRIVIDTAIGHQEVMSQSVRDATADWFDTSLLCRLHNANEGIVVIESRLHQHDLTGHIADGDWSTYDWLMIQMEYDCHRPCKTSIGWKDPRTQEGELAWPNRFSREEVDQLKSALGFDLTHALLQQMPFRDGND